MKTVDTDRHQYLKDYYISNPNISFRVKSVETRDLIRLQADLAGLTVGDWVLSVVMEKLFDDVVRST